DGDFHTFAYAKFSGGAGIVGGRGAASEFSEGRIGTGTFGAADRHRTGKRRGVFPGDACASVGALRAEAHVRVSGQRDDGIDQGDFARGPGRILEAELFSGRCGAGGDGKHQTRGAEAAAGKTIRRVEGRETRAAAAEHARDDGRETDSGGPSRSAA